MRTMQAKRFSTGLAGILLAGLLFAPLASAQTAPAGASDFALQVTPSPLVATVQPGQTSHLPLTIRNLGSDTEMLKVETRSFSFNSRSGQVKLDDTAPADIGSWITFANPTPTIASGQVINDQMNIAVPADSGFSYSFAVLISRKNNLTPTQGGRVLKGALAVFSLLNVDRPGASRQLQVASFTASHHIYEYLPATINIRFKNTGNTIVQPYGNLFIQRSSTSPKPLATLAVNASSSYILPNTERTESVNWNDGFPAYTTVTAADGSQHQHLSWDFTHLNKLRIGQYTAKLVAVYSDGQHDIPIEAEVSFWVFPWRAALGLIVVIVGLVFLIRWRLRARTDKAVKKALAAQKTTPKK